MIDFHVNDLTFDINFWSGICDNENLVMFSCKGVQVVLFGVFLIDY